MAVFYRLHQDQSTGTKRSGKRFFSLNPFCFLTRARRKIRSRIVSPWDFLHIFLR